MPLPGLAWVHLQASAVKIDRRPEILDIPEPARSKFHRRNPGIQTLRHSSGNQHSSL
jgi:hypothetical protein